MAKDIIEILSPYGSDEPVQRMKIHALKHHLGNDFAFRPFEQSGDRTACVLINNCLPQDLFTAIQTKAGSAVIMLFLPDLIPEVISVLRNWVDVVDVILVGTP